MEEKSPMEEKSRTGEPGDERAPQGARGTESSTGPAVVKKFKPVTLVLSLALLAVGVGVFYRAFGMGRAHPVGHLLGAGAAVLIGVFLLTRVRVPACGDCGDELVEGTWLFPLGSEATLRGAVESGEATQLLSSVRDEPTPPVPAPGALTYAALDFDICPSCHAVGRVVLARRTFGRADGTRVQVRRLGGVREVAGAPLREAFERAKEQRRDTVVP